MFMKRRRESLDCLLGQEGERENEKSPLRLPKIRAMVLDRHKRLYLGCTTETRMLFMLPVASICNHDKDGIEMSHKTIRSLRTIAYKLAMIWTIRTRGMTEQ